MWLIAATAALLMHVPLALSQDGVLESIYVEVPARKPDGQFWDPIGTPSPSFPLLKGLLPDVQVCVTSGKRKACTAVCVDSRTCQRELNMEVGDTVTVRISDVDVGEDDLIAEIKVDKPLSRPDEPFTFKTDNGPVVIRFNAARPYCQWNALWLWGTEELARFSGRAATMEQLSRENAEATARRIREDSPRWTEYLPSCPLRVADTFPPGEWVDDDPKSRRCMHPGAARCKRSKTAYESRPGTRHGQQCCYNARGDLLRERGHHGLGTPDFAAPPDSPVLYPDYAAAHFESDVAPFLGYAAQMERLSGATDGQREAFAWYHETWKPNRGPLLVGGTAVQSGFVVRPGDRLAIRAHPASQVSLLFQGREIAVDRKGIRRERRAGSTTERDTLNAIWSEEQLNARQRPLPSSNRGALIGWVARPSGERLQVFSLSEDVCLDMQSEGQLMIGINDAPGISYKGHFVVDVLRTIDQSPLCQYK